MRINLKKRDFMWEKLESAREWFLNQTNPAKIGIIIAASLIIILIIFLTLNIVFPSDTPLTGDALEKYKASCNVISFQDLISNVNKYNGQHLKFTGQIDQINVNNGRTEILLSVTQVNGVWSSSDLIFVTYKAQTTFKKGDIVTVYGDVSGTYNFISASLGNLILVKITARYVELTPNTTPTVIPVPFTSPSSNNTNTTTNTSGSVNITDNNSTNPSNVPDSNPSTTTSNGQAV
jgi:hypothetical protein